jgi:hypothetical protein
MNTFIVEIKNERLTEWYRVEISKDNTPQYKKLDENKYDENFTELLKGFPKVNLEYDSPLIQHIQSRLCTKSKKKCLVNVYHMKEREKKRTLYEMEYGIVKEEPKLKKRSDGKKKKKKRSRRDGVRSRVTSPVTSPRRAAERRRQPDNVIDLTYEPRQKRKSIKAERKKLSEERKSTKQQKTKLREKKLDNSECGICFDEFDLEAENCVVLKTCGHSYHIDCINQWLGDRNEKTCPNCRVVFQRNGWFHCHEIDIEALQKKIKKDVDKAKKKNNYIEIQEIIDVDPDVIEIE